MDILPDPVSFESALEKFISYLRNQKRSSATTIAYKSDLEQVKKHLNEKRITQATTISTEHLQGYIDWLGSLGYTPKSVSRKINSLKTFFRYLHEEGVIIANPAHPLTHPKIESKAPRILSASEIKNLRDVTRLDIRIAAIVELLLQTGMRISELACLTVEDVKKHELHIKAQESNPARTIALNHPAATSLNNYLAIRPKVTDNHVFVTKTGRPLLVRNIRTAIDRYFKKSGVKDVKVNDLRHTFVAHQLKNGVDPEVVNRHIGHRRLSSTQKYLDFIKVEIAELSSRLTEL